MTRHKKHRPKLNSLYQWHRYLGLAVALLAVLLAVTGMMLNHTERLRLDQRQLDHRWLLGWYGIPSPEAHYFRLGDQWLSQWDQQVYLNDRKLSFEVSGRLVGAFESDDMIVAAGNDSLLLLTADGQLIERLGALDGVPDNISAIAPGKGEHVILRTGSGVFDGDPATGKWQVTRVTANWSQPESPPEDLASALHAQHPGPTLPLERVILDLHSGRLFGSWGSYIMDAAAVLLLFNAASGVFIWWRRRRQQRYRAKRL